MSDLNYLFKPRSIAVVGASRYKEKVGNVIFRNLLSTFHGKLYPVNAKAEDVEGVKAFKSVKEIPDDIDLGIITVPREIVPQVMEELVEKGVRASIVITAGFREVGEEKLENEVIGIARKGGIRVLGPNTFGIITPEFNATFTYTDVKRGNIGLVVQSGGLGVYMLNWAQKYRIGISYMVSLGNQADVKEYEVINYLSRDAETRAIFVYLEGVSDGNAFLETLPEATRRKPVVFLKGGVTNSGASAAKTHTGSLAGSFEVFKAAVKTVGGILVENLHDMLNLAKILMYSEPISEEILVITNSGGHGVLVSDEIDRNKLRLVEIPEWMKKELTKILPPTSLPKNPLDLTGDADKERYYNALKIVSNLDCTKLIIVQSLPMVSCSDVARTVSNFKGKGVIGVTMGLDEDMALKILETTGIPGYTFPEDAVKAIRYYTSRPTPRRKIRTIQPIEAALELVRGKKTLKDFEALKLMEIYGIRTPKWGLATNENEAQNVADNIGFPVVMKISPDTPVHKTEMKGVVVNVEKEDVKKVYSELSKITSRVLIQQQLNGLEIFVGGLKDPAFGHVVLVGSGGIYVEVLKNVAYALSPVYEDEAQELLVESKIHDMLYARKRGYDENSLIRTITRVSRMIVDLNVKEMDINPLFVNENGAFAVDVRIVLE
ncbi:acetate--CoA ligase family protein [Saccharolobus islandicus]|uniref:Acetyl coenzyme A synthetase (ADP forming), alpha domain protein n=3 Tax=Saccharolobus TaxID=2100760 RepID=C4KFH8_SACI6|nr:acetate--CoA ligase family protein [Sulfolobus islandicus]ACP37553.1 acetyl coenzyme A synthetase (ADP forming), alpha domain protein [Sulfolobus islandicus M.14.25]ACR41394.1 acetyl coenzyme A synthetase (ADP forming), alpha domain protein [Sulfolobus islandicus M.16.4]